MSHKRISMSHIKELVCYIQIVIINIIIMHSSMQNEQSFLIWLNYSITYKSVCLINQILFCIFIFLDELVMPKN